MERYNPVVLSSAYKVVAESWPDQGGWVFLVVKVVAGESSGECEVLQYKVHVDKRPGSLLSKYKTYPNPCLMLTVARGFLAGPDMRAVHLDILMHPAFTADPHRPELQQFYMARHEEWKSTHKKLKQRGYKKYMLAVQYKVKELLEQHNQVVLEPPPYRIAVKKYKKHL